jgi:hypothetical protein
MSKPSRLSRVLLGTSLPLLLLAAAAVTIASFTINGCTANPNTRSSSTQIYTTQENPTIYPIHTTTITAASMDDIDALNAATDGAMKFCTANYPGKSAEVLKRTTEYLGVTPAEKRIVTTADEVFGKNPSNIKTRRDYRVILKFRCIDPSEA